MGRGWKAEYRPFMNDSDGLFGRLRLIEAFDSVVDVFDDWIRNRFSLDQKALQHYLRTDVNDDL